MSLSLQSSLPFALVTGEGLGVSHASTISSTKSLWPAASLGDAKLQVAVNGASGNLYVRDHALRLTEATGTIALAYHYNSQARTPWQLGVPALVIDDAGKVILREADGHETSYELDEASQTYFASEYTDGQPFFTYDSDTQTWSHTQPGSDVTAYYDANGLLIKQVDKRGHTTTYQYTDGILSEIQSASGVVYRITPDTVANTVTVSRVADEVETVWQVYAFDTSNRLVTSTTGDAYQTTYTYDTDTGVLANIEQTDNSVLTINWQDSAIDSIDVGKDDQAISYALQYTDSSATLQTPDGSAYQLSWDENDKASGLTTTASTGDTLSSFTVTYNANGQVEKITDLANNVEQFTYEETHALLSVHQTADGETIKRFYSTEAQPVLLAEGKVLGAGETASLLATRYAYQTSTDGTQRLLSFEVSPAGRVTAYRYDDSGSLIAIVRYQNATYTDGATPEVSLDLTALTTWANALPPASIDLTDVTENARGQITQKVHFASVDEEGNGVADKTTSVERFDWDDANHLQQHSVQQTPDQVDTTIITYDPLHRVTSKQDAAGNLTAYAYDGGTVTITAPNGRVTVQTRDSTHRLIVQSVRATNAAGVLETHETQYASTDPSQVAIIDPDGCRTMHLYDADQTLRYMISETGIVTAYVAHPAIQCVETTHYHTALNVTGTQASAWTVATVTDALVAAREDQTSLLFHDASGRPLLTIDAGDYAVQTFYDSLHRVIGTSRYRQRLTQDTRADFKAQGLSALASAAFTQGKKALTRYFYDDDGKRVGSVNPAGYLTEYRYDAAGFLTDTLVYKEKLTGITMDLIWSAIPRATMTVKAHTYHFNDQRGQVILEVDPKGFITTFEYTANGLLAREYHYATPVTADWMASPTTPPVPVVSASNDIFTDRTYDLMGRLATLTTSSGKMTSYAYDVMGNRTQVTISDTTAPDRSDADAKRQTFTRYDGFDQTVATLSPLATEDFTDLPTDADWQTRASRVVYDAMGQVIQQTDALGHVTYLYYDTERRLVATINPRGAVTEYAYDVFGNRLEERAQKKRLSSTIRATLTGGTLDATLLATLTTNRSTKDAVIHRQYNPRNQVKAMTDAQGHHSRYAYDEAKRLTHAHLPVSNEQPSMTVRHVYNVSGEETATHQSAGDLHTKVKREYHHPAGLITRLVDEVGVETIYAYDALNRLESQRTGEHCLTYTYDAMDRVLTETDAKGQVTQHAYDPIARTHTITSPDNQVKVVQTENIFGEVISRTNALGETETITHHASGGVNVQQDALGHRLTTRYDVEGRKIRVQDVNGEVTRYRYNTAGQLIRQTDDAKRSRLITRYRRDAFGLPTTLIDALGIVTKQAFNRNHVLMQTLRDPKTKANPNGLHVMTTYHRNAQGAQTGLQIGDANEANQYDKMITRDALGRAIGSVIDPDGLQLTTAQTLDAAGQIRITQEANGACTYRFYDANRQLRCEVRSDGSAIEYGYDTAGVKVATYTYAGHLAAEDVAAITAATSLASVQVKLNAIVSAADGEQRIFPDANGREKYVVDVLQRYDADQKGYVRDGIVTERVYDAASREINTIHYAATLDAQGLAQLSITDLATRLATIADPTLDRTMQYRYDANGRERYAIRQDGKVTEKRYNAKGRLITSIDYDAPLTDLTNVLTSSDADFTASVNAIANAARDRATHDVYDRLDRLTHTVNPEGGVTRKDYDAMHRVVKTTQFDAPLKIAPQAMRDVIEKQVLALVADPTVDSVSTFGFDADGRLAIATDALGHAESYTYDAVGNTRTHTNRGAQTWTYGYDRGKRLTDEISPTTTVTSTALQDGQLVATTAQQAVVKKMAHDEVGNVTSITQGFGLPDAQTQTLGYNAQHQITSTAIENVPIDDVSQAASLTTLPTTATTVMTRTVYHGRGQPIVEIAENNGVTFRVYDSLGRERYVIYPNRQVTEKAYNAFNQCTLVTRYAQPFAETIDLTAYLETGLSLDQVMGGLTPHADLDRCTEDHYDAVGNRDSRTKGARFYYADGESGTAQPKTDYAYNLFGEVIQKVVWQSPTVESVTQYFRDRLGEVIATFHPGSYLTLRPRDPFGKVQQIEAYANPLTTTPTAGMDVTALRTLVTLSSSDRIKRLGYNLLGTLTDTVLVNTTYYHLTLNEKGVADTAAFTGDLTQHTAFDAMQSPQSITYEDGSAVYQFHDERGYLTAKTEVKRTPYSGVPAYLIPLTTYGIDAQGRPVRTTRHAQSALDPVDSVPVVASDAADQTELLNLHPFGQATYRQDAEGNLQVQTYTTGRQLARTVAINTMWQNTSTIVNAPVFTSSNHLEETRFAYDDVGSAATEVSVWLDNVMQRINYYRYNVFNERTGESGDNLTWYATQTFDATGRRWLDTVTGAPTITLYDLADNPTLSLRSPTLDLSTTAYADLATLLQTDEVTLERTEKIYDIRQGLIGLKAPYWSEKNVNGLYTYRCERDRWGNPLEEYDHEGYQRSHRYDANNQVIFTQDPETDVTGENGKQTRLRPWTANYFNERGHHLATRNTYSFLEAFFRDPAGQLFQHTLPDGTREQVNIFDIFGNRTVSYTASDAATTFEYNRLHQVTTLLVPGSLPRAFAYTPSGLATLATGFDNNVYRLNYFQGDVIARFQPLGTGAFFVYDHQHLLTREVCESGYVKSWVRTYTGQVQNHTNYGSLVTYYEYNQKMEVTREYQEASPGELLYHSIAVTYPTVSTDFPLLTHHASRDVPPPMDIYYRYCQGLRTSLIDPVSDKTSVFDYNGGGHLTSVTVQEASTSQVLRKTTQDYDELGRESLTIDAILTASGNMATLSYDRTFDGMNNIVTIGYDLQRPGYSSVCHLPPQSWTDVFSYNANDEVIVAYGNWGKDGGAVIAPGKGSIFGYGKNLRVSETSSLANGTTVLATISYTTDGALYHTSTNNGYASTQFMRLYDATHSLFATATITWTKETNKAWWNTYLYIDKNDRVTACVNTQNNGQTVNRSTFGYAEGYAFPTQQITEQYDNDGSYAINRYVMPQCLYLDDSYPYYASGTRVENGVSTKGNSLMLRYPDGRVNGKIFAADETNFKIGTYPSTYFETTYDGALWGKESIPLAITSTVVQGTYYFSTPDGRLLGSFTDGYDLRSDLTVKHYDEHAAGCGNFCTIVPQNIDLQFVQYPRTVAKIAEPADLSQESVSPVPAISTIPTLQTQTYLVREGDTFESIAQMMCGGDEVEYGALIRDRNALLHTATLAPGTVLFLPSYIPKKHKASSGYTVDSFISAIQGSLLPFLPNPTPQPPHRHHHSFLQMLGRVIVAALAAGLAIELGGLFAGWAAEFMTGLFTAAGDAASQGLSIKLGWQDKFSMAEVVQSGVTAGLASGPISTLSNGAALSEEAVAVLELSAISVSTQLLLVKLGLQEKFDLRGVVTDIAAMVGGAKLDGALAGSSDSMTVVRNVAKTVANTALGTMIQHAPIDAESLTANAMGSIASDEFSERLAASKPQPDSTQSTTNGNHYAAQKQQVKVQAAKNDRTLSEEPSVDIAPLPDPGLDLSKNNIKANLGKVNQAAMREPKRAVTAQDQVASKDRPTEKLSTMSGVATNSIVTAAAQVGRECQGSAVSMFKHAYKPMIQPTAKKFGGYFEEYEVADLKSMLDFMKIPTDSPIEKLLDGSKVFASLPVGGEVKLGAVGTKLAGKFLTPALAATMKLFAVGSVKVVEDAIVGTENILKEISPFKLNPTESLSMSKREFKRFLEKIKSEGIQESIKYVEHNGEKYIVDGHHRLQASKILGIEKVLIEKVELPYKGYKDENDLNFGL